MERDDRRDSLETTDLRRFLRWHGISVVCTGRQCSPSFSDKRTYESQRASPGGAYRLLARSGVGLGRVDDSRTSIVVVRMSDIPVVPGTSQDLEQEDPRASDGAKVGLSLGWGEEPHWTHAEVDHLTTPAH
jgi:hypothetical protein